MILFIYRLLQQVGMFLVISLPLTLIGLVILLPIICVNQHYTVKYKKSWKLPFLFRWFDCVDLYEEFERNPVTYLALVVPEGVLYRYYWLAFRNPINYFSYKYLGFQIDSNKVTLKEQFGNPNVGDGSGELPGLYQAEINKYYEYYYIYKWNQTHCLRFRMGWKIGDTNKIKDRQWVQQVLVLQPYRSYSGV